MIAENIRSLRLSQLLKIDFHAIAGIVQIAEHIRPLRSSRSLRSLCYDFHTIAGITALVVSINLLQSLTIIHDRYDCRDRLWFYPCDPDRCDLLQLLGSLAITGKMKIWFPYEKNWLFLWKFRSLYSFIQILISVTLSAISINNSCLFVKPGFRMVSVGLTGPLTVFMCLWGLLALPSFLSIYDCWGSFRVTESLFFCFC